MKAASIQTQNLSIGFGKGSEENCLQSGLNLTFQSGELIGVIGPNGIGKSTLLRTLSGLQAPLNGTILINNKHIQHYPKRALAQTIAFVSTEWINISHLRVFDLVALARFPYSNWLGQLNRTDRLLVSESLELTGVLNLQDRLFDTLSDGEKQRVLVARSLAQETPVLIMDEPAAFLDIAHKFELIRSLHTLSREKNKLILISIHDIDVAIQEADKILLLHRKGLSEGSPEDLILNGNLPNIFGEALLQFDIDCGSFYLPRTPNTILPLKGEGIRWVWTEKALVKAGFRCVPASTQDDTFVAVETDSWVLHQKAKNSVFNSLGELIKSLSSK